MPEMFSGEEQKREFIGAIFDDEGCVALRVFKRTREIKRNLDISSKSRRFLRDIKRVLEDELNIKCNKIIWYNKKLGGKTFTTYKLSITGRENIETFKRKIKIVHPKKIIDLYLMVNSYIRPRVGLEKLKKGDIV